MAYLGYGTIFKWKSYAVAELTNVGGLELSNALVDVTAHDTANGILKSLASKIKDGGSIDISGFVKLDDTNGQVAMLASFYASEEGEVIITHPSSVATLTFNAVIEKIKPLGEADETGAIAFSATIKVNSLPVLAVTTTAGMSACVIAAVAGAGTVTWFPTTFAIGVFDYVVICSSATSIKFTPTSAAGTITLTGPDGLSQGITSAGDSSPQALTVAVENQFTIVISQANMASKTYHFRVERLA